MSDVPLNIGFIGFGSVSIAYARGLAGHTMVSALYATDPMLDHDVYGPSIRRNAEVVGVDLVPDPTKMPVCDLLFIATPGEVTKDALSSLGPSNRGGEIIVDVTTAAIEDKIENARAAETIGARYVDGAIVGPIPVLGIKAPILASGDAATDFKSLGTPLAMDIEVVSGSVGDAVAAKYIRSIFTKGFESLILEVTVAAESLGVTDVVMRGLSKTFDAQTFAENADRCIREDSIHAGRRSIEMQNVSRFLSIRGLPNQMTTAASETLAWSASLGTREFFGGQAPEGSAEALKEVLVRAGLTTVEAV